MSMALFWPRETFHITPANFTMAHVILHIRRSDSVEVCSLDFCNLIRASSGFSKTVPLGGAKLLLLVGSWESLKSLKFNLGIQKTTQIESNCATYILKSSVFGELRNPPSRYCNLKSYLSRFLFALLTDFWSDLFCARNLRIWSDQTGQSFIHRGTKNVEPYNAWVLVPENLGKKMMVNPWIVIFPVNIAMFKHTQVFLSTISKSAKASPSPPGIGTHIDLTFIPQWPQIVKLEAQERWLQRDKEIKHQLEREKNTQMFSSWNTLKALEGPSCLGGCHVLIRDVESIRAQSSYTSSVSLRTIIRNWSKSCGHWSKFKTQGTTGFHLYL